MGGFFNPTNQGEVGNNIPPNFWLWLVVAVAGLAVVLIFKK